MYGPTVFNETVRQRKSQRCIFTGKYELLNINNSE